MSCMAEKTYTVQSAIAPPYLLSVSGSSLLCTLELSMPALLFFEPFSRALRRKTVGDFLGVIRITRYRLQSSKRQSNKDSRKSSKTAEMIAD